MSSTTIWLAQEVVETLAILSAMTVKRLVVEQKVKQKISKTKLEILFSKTKISKAIFALNTLLTAKQPINGFLKKI